MTVNAIKVGSKGGLGSPFYICDSTIILFYSDLYEMVKSKEKKSQLQIEVLELSYNAPSLGTILNCANVQSVHLVTDSKYMHIGPQSICIVGYVQKVYLLQWKKQLVC